MADAPPQRPTTSEADVRQHEASLYLGSLLLSADRAHDQRPSTGLSLSRGLGQKAARAHTPTRQRPPRVLEPVITSSFAAAAKERERREQWVGGEELLLDEGGRD